MIPRSGASSLIALALALGGCVTTTPNRIDPPVDALRMAATRTAAAELRAELESYYGGSDVLLETWLLQPEDPGYRAGLEFLADKIARALVWRESFVIGTIGSSVTAGYDNCRRDGYQAQLERIMTPLWTAAEVRFEIRNTGQGGDCGDNFQNQVFCLRALVGDDVDMTHYSWTYFESGHAAEEIAAFHEMFYRWSLLLDRTPAPQLIYTHDCSKLKPFERELLDLYAPFGADVLCMERGIQRAGYPGKKWGVVGDTLHETTREGELLAADDPRRESLGVVFRNWHPGPLLFQTTADAMAYRYAAAMLLALDRIETEPEPQLRWPQRSRFDRARELPKAMACDPEWCDSESVPDCLVFEKPTFGETGVQQLAPNNPDNPHSDLADLADVGWSEWQGPSADKYVPKEERDLPGCGHPNRCAGLVAEPGEQAGWLTFRLPDLEVGLVAVCCSRKKCGSLLLDADPELLIDGRPPSQPPEVLWGGKCLQVQARFAEGATTGSRTIHLGIRLPPSEEPPPAISHVIGF